jgi:hypothetical protein
MSYSLPHVDITSAGLGVNAHRSNTGLPKMGSYKTHAQKELCQIILNRILVAMCYKDIKFRRHLSKRWE